MTGSRYSRIKLEKTDMEQLSFCANHGYANVLSAKLNARSSFDCSSAIWIRLRTIKSAEQIFPGHMLCLFR